MPARQRGARQAGSGTEDRRAGLRLARAIAGARAAAGQFRATGPDARAPRSHPLPESAHPGAEAGRRTGSHKVLQDADIKLASVARDILGVSSRAMLAALVQGTTDPAVLADLARGKLRRKRPALRQALAGRFRAHHAFLVSQLLAHLDYLDEAIETVSGQVAEVIAPFGGALQQLDTIPGVATRTAEVLVAELGVDMRRFPTDRHLASWAAALSRQPRECGKAPVGHDSQGQPLAPGRPHRGGARGHPVEGQCIRGPLPPSPAPPGASKSRGGRRPCPTPHRLSAAGPGHDLPEPGTRLLRAPAYSPRHAPRHSAVGSPRLPGHSRARGVTRRGF